MLTRLSVDYSGANMTTSLRWQPSEGDLVLVKGFTFDPERTFVATRVELRSTDLSKADAGYEPEVEGTIIDFVSATAFKVAGRAVTTKPPRCTSMEPWRISANDVLVEVEGTADAAGVLVALKVRFKEISTIRIVAQLETLVLQPMAP